MNCDILTIRCLEKKNTKYCTKCLISKLLNGDVSALIYMVFQRVNSCRLYLKVDKKTNISVRVLDMGCKAQCLMEMPSPDLVLT